jgi:anthranilate synthase component 1
MYYPSLDEFRKKSARGNLVPVYKEILADMETPVSALRKIDNGKYAFLLESVEGGENIAQYSFLGSNPSMLFWSKNDKVNIIKNGTKEQLVGVKDPVDELKKLMSEFNPVGVKGLPRFHGGAVGYISYDMVRFFERLPESKGDELDIPDCFFMITDTILVFDHVNHKIKVVSNAHINNRDGVEEAYIKAIEKIEDIISTLKQPLSYQRSIKNGWDENKVKSNFTKDEYEKSVDKAKEYIKAGDIVQVVPSQRLSVPISADPFNIYRGLRTINPSPYMYYLKMDDIQIAGSSPEVMVRVDEGTVTMRPIAGTARRGSSDEEDKELAKHLLADPKEQAEHVMLVDLGRNDVGRVCQYGTVKVDELMVIEKYSHVMHIVSNVTGKLRSDKDSFDVLRACLPAGTVSGAPKIRAMEIINELEPSQRGVYAGAVGYFSFSGNSDTAIAIRTILIKNGMAYIQAGGGVVADSIPSSEYQETLNKAMACMKAIQLAEEGLE